MIYNKVRTDPDILFTTLMLSPQYEKCVSLLLSFFVFLLLGCWASNCGDSDGLLILSAWSCSSNWWVGGFFGWLVDLVWVFWPDAFSGSRHVCYGSCCSVAGCLLAVGGRVSPLGSIWAVEWQSTIDLGGNWAVFLNWIWPMVFPGHQASLSSEHCQSPHCVQ